MPLTLEISNAALEDDTATIERYITRKPENINLTYSEMRLSPLFYSSIYYGKKAFASWIGLNYLTVLAAGILSAGTVATNQVIPIFRALLNSSILGWGLAYAQIYLPYTLGDRGLYPRSFHREGWTLLHFAAAGNALKVAAYLIEQGADVTIKDANNRTFKDIAMTCGHHDFSRAVDLVVEAYVKSKAAVNNARQETLNVAEQCEKILEDSLQKLEKNEAKKNQIFQSENRELCSTAMLNKCIPKSSTPSKEKKSFKNDKRHSQYLPTPRQIEQLLKIDRKDDTSIMQRDLKHQAFKK